MPMPRSATASRTASCSPATATMLMTSPSASTLEAGRTKQRRELRCPFVDDDDEPLGVAAAELAEDPRAHHGAVAEDHHRVADLLGLLQVVRRDHDVHAELGADPPDQRQHVVALERVEAVGRLVEQDEGGIVNDCSGELHALALAGRHRPDRPEPLLPEPDLPECIVRALDRSPPREAVQLPEMAHEIRRVDVGRQVVMLGRESDPRPNVDPRRRGIVPEHGQLAGVTGAQAEHERDERRLPRSVRAEQPGDAVADVDVEGIDGQLRPVPLAHTPGANDRRRGVRAVVHPPARSLRCAISPIFASAGLRTRRTANRSMPRGRTSPMETIKLDQRYEAMLALVALATALLTFQTWRPGAAIAAAVLVGLVGLRRGLPVPLVVASTAAAGSALVHFAVAPEHFAEWWGFGLFFVLCAEVQLGWALLLGRIRGNRMLAVGLVGSLFLVAVWAVSRTTGLPFGPEPGVPEEIGRARSRVGRPRTGDGRGVRLGARSRAAASPPGAACRCACSALH